MNIDAPPCLLGRKWHTFLPGGRICLACRWAPVPLDQPIAVRRRYSAFDRVRDYWGPGCVFCGAEATTRDHLVPKSRGGTDHLSNLRPCCRPCNALKADMTPAEWLGDRCPEELKAFTTSVPRSRFEVERQQAARDRQQRRISRARREELVRQYLATQR